VPSFLQLALTQAKWSKKQNWKGQKCPQGCTRVNFFGGFNLKCHSAEYFQYMPPFKSLGLVSLYSVFFFLKESCIYFNVITI